jgi:hypothetical protein
MDDPQPHCRATTNPAGFMLPRRESSGWRLRLATCVVVVGQTLPTVTRSECARAQRTARGAAARLVSNANARDCSRQRADAATNRIATRAILLRNLPPLPKPRCRSPATTPIHPHPAATPEARIFARDQTPGLGVTPLQPSIEVRIRTRPGAAKRHQHTPLAHPSLSQEPRPIARLRRELLRADLAHPLRADLAHPQSKNGAPGPRSP